MLFDSLHCKGLLVHMYFLDEKCVLIFKTDNNKMLYLKIVCFEYIFYVIFCQSQWDEMTRVSIYKVLKTNQIVCYTVLPTDFSRCTNSRVSSSGIYPETRQIYWFPYPSEVLTLDWAHCCLSATLPTTANCSSLNDTSVSLSLNTVYFKGSGTSIMYNRSRRSAVTLWICFSSCTMNVNCIL